VKLREITANEPPRPWRKSVNGVVTGVNGSYGSVLTFDTFFFCEELRHHTMVPPAWRRN